MGKREKCPWCDEKSKSWAGLCNHVRSKHDVKEYIDRGMSVSDIIQAKRKANEIRIAEISESLRSAEGPKEEAPIKDIALEEVKPEKIREEKRESKREKKRRARRLFSENHPGAFQVSANVLPKTGLILLGLLLTWDALTSMFQGDYLFYQRWYQMSIVGPLIVGIFLFPGGPMEWIEIYGVVASLIGVIAVILLLVFYRLIWRYFFKDYSIVRGQTELREGRVYWWTGNIWTRIWDKLYRSGERVEHVLYIKQYFWPPLNPLNPRNSLIKLHLSIDEEVEYDSLFSLTGKEKRFRVYIGENELATTDDAQKGREIPLMEINDVFRDRREHLIGDTQKFSMANPNVRLDLLRDGTYLVPEDFTDGTAREKA